MEFPFLSTGFRAAASPDVVLKQLHSLAGLPGTWVGNGFNLIAVPDFEHGGPFQLKFNVTKEILTFTPVGAPIPNRGAKQKDIRFTGLHYFQQVSDNVTNEALHLEPGIWLPIPDTTAPAQCKTIVRLSTIPHGNSLLAQGAAPPDKPVDGGPKIGAVDSLPFTVDPLTGARQDVTARDYLEPYLSMPMPDGIPVVASINPNIVLVRFLEQQAKRGQIVISTTELNVSATPVGGIAPGSLASPEGASGGITNIPFLVTNAKAMAFAATFWVETVQNPDAKKTTFAQLQYSQTTILDFGDLKWPHITVATLVQQ